MHRLRRLRRCLPDRSDHDGVIRSPGTDRRLIAPGKPGEPCGVSSEPFARPLSVRAGIAEGAEARRHGQVPLSATGSTGLTGVGKHESGLRSVTWSRCAGRDSVARLAAADAAEAVDPSHHRSRTEQPPQAPHPWNGAVDQPPIGHEGDVPPGHAQTPLGQERTWGFRPKSSWKALRHGATQGSIPFALQLRKLRKIHRFRARRVIAGVYVY